MLILKLFSYLNVKMLIPVKIYCYNDSAIKLALNPVFQENTKHFEVDVHFVCDKVLKGVLRIVKISFKNQRDDIFTKVLTFKQHYFLCFELVLFYLFLQ